MIKREDKIKSVSVKNSVSVKIGKESSKVLLFERDKGFLCIPIGCNLVHTFVLANKNTETTLAPLKRQYFNALFIKIGIGMLLPHWTACNPPEQHVTDYGVHGIQNDWLGLTVSTQKSILTNMHLVPRFRQKCVKFCRFGMEGRFWTILIPWTP